MQQMTTDDYLRLVQAAEQGMRLADLINTPELVDFPKAVHMEAVHQEVRWGTPDREGKSAYDWHWLVAHLATRALEHDKEAQRLEAQCTELAHEGAARDVYEEQIAHHRKKAVHHCITAAAALSHWHAAMLGKATAMRPSSAEAAKAAATLQPARWFQTT